MPTNEAYFHSEVSCYNLHCEFMSGQIYLLFYLIGKRA